MKTIQAFETEDGEIFADKKEVLKREGYLYLSKELKNQDAFGPIGLNKGVFGHAGIGVRNVNELLEFLDRFGGNIKAAMGWVDADHEPTENPWIVWGQGSMPVLGDIWVDYIIDEIKAICRNEARFLKWDCTGSGLIRKYRVSANQDGE